MKTVILVFIFTLTLCATALAQSNFTDDTFVITTYYPAPYGVYRNMRLYPSDEPTNGVDRGVMYFNQTNDQLYIYQNDTTKWQPLGGGGGGETNIIVGVNTTCPSGQDIVMKVYNGIWYAGDNPAITSWNKVVCGKIMSPDGTPFLVSGFHTTKQCTDTKVNGVNGAVFNDSAGWQACRFNAASCPTGSPNWVQYSNWSTTTGGQTLIAPLLGSCSGWGDCRGSSVVVGQHASWANTPQESAQACTADTGCVCVQQSVPGPGCVAYTWCGSQGPDYVSCGGCSVAGVCGARGYATITQIGCY
jgi:hypothetical protein